MGVDMPSDEEEDEADEADLPWHVHVWISHSSGYITGFINKLFYTGTFHTTIFTSNSSI
jgi:hypothetical protein